MIMRAQTVIRHAQAQAQGEVGAEIVDAIMTNFRSLCVTDQDTVTRFARMIQHGTGGAEGMHATTRLEALTALAWLLGVRPESAVMIAGAVSLGAWSQGRAVTNLITARRQLPTT